MLLKQLIPYKIQKNNDMNNHIRNFSDIIDKLKEMEIKLVKEFINNISMILLYNISYENFRIIIEVQEELPTLKILKIRLLKEVKVRKHKNVYFTRVMFTNKNLKNNFKLKRNKNYEKKGEKMKTIREINYAVKY